MTHLWFDSEATVRFISIKVYACEEYRKGVWAGKTVAIRLISPLKKALLTGFHSTAKHNATKAVSPSSEPMRTI